MTATTAEKIVKTQRGGTILKFNVAELRSAFSAVKDVVPARPSRPVLGNVMIGSDGTLSATDLEIRVTYPLPGATGPAVLLPHARMLAILNNCSDTAEVTMVVDGSVCKVACAGGRWSLPTEAVSEFPDAHEGIGRPISRLPADQFTSMMGNVKFATDAKAGRPAYTGVLIEFANDKESEYGRLTFVASDGRRICWSQCEVDQDLDPSSTLVPRRAVDVICKLCGGRDAIQLETAGTELIANIDGVVVQARLVAGDFPAWRKVLPDREVTPSVAGVAPLLHACQMAAICTSESSRGTRMTFGEKGLKLAGKSSEYGESSASCELVEVGQQCELEINPGFAIEWLESLDRAAMVDIEAESGTAALLLRCDDAFTVIMPLSKD
jgi:DNA polymerase III subunit beta